VQRKLAPLYVVVGMKGRRLRVGSALLTRVREVADFSSFSTIAPDNEHGSRKGPPYCVPNRGVKMSRQDNPQAHPNFDAPIEVITDPLLSKQEKAESLEDLEQDARQLATASGEGMSGGEPTALAEVLHAKEALELPSTDFAYELVLKDLEARRLTGDGDAGLIAQAAAALAALRKPAG
jgi:hypothetical protein